MFIAIINTLSIRTTRYRREWHERGDAGNTTILKNAPSIRTTPQKFRTHARNRNQPPAAPDVRVRKTQTQSRGRSEHTRADQNHNAGTLID
eukprot:2287681-Lingulodinium_polyedra.AAC.1